MALNTKGLIQVAVEVAPGEEVRPLPQSVSMLATRVVMHQIVLPSEVDVLGICFGGQASTRTSHHTTQIIAASHSNWRSLQCSNHNLRTAHLSISSTVMLVVSIVPCCSHITATHV